MQLLIIFRNACKGKSVNLEGKFRMARRYSQRLQRGTSVLLKSQSSGRRQR